MKSIRYTKWGLAITFSSLIIIMINYEIVSFATKDKIIKDITDVPQSDICLILGTPKYLPDGNINNYYHCRILSTIALFENHKVKKILISADTSNKYSENEVELIKNDLLKNGIRDSDILCDKKGNRTWNSISNVRKFDGKKIIIVSQNFHLERALYLAQRNRLNALGFISDGVPSIRLIIREAFARIKMQIDLALN